VILVKLGESIREEAIVGGDDTEWLGNLVDVP